MSSAEIIQQVIQKEQETLANVASALGDLDSLVSAILECPGKLIVTGMGKSGLVGRKISATFSSTATPSNFVHPAEALHGDIGTIEQADLVLAVSNSGETEELLALIPFLKRRNVKIAAMSCEPDSSLAQKSDFLIPLNVGQEADPFSLIPTCSTTAMLAVGDALAIAVLSQRGLTREKFAELHPSGSIGRKLLLLVEDIMHREAEIPTVPSGTTIREAVCEMGAKRLGSTFVVAKDNPQSLLGVFTDGDLRRLLNQKANPLETSIDEVMTRNPRTIAAKRLAVEAVGIMQQNAISVLPVLDSSGLMGAIHLHDLLKAGLG